MNILILGRENVGKSTLFNCLTGERTALTSQEPGTTRDSKFGTVLWRDASFTIIDTAGITITAETILTKEIQKQINKSLDIADIILFIVDAETGIVAQDRKVVSMIRKKGLPYLLVVNKVDSPKKEHLGEAFMRLGLGNYYMLSAKSGLGTGDMLDALYEKLTVRDDRRFLLKDDRLKISIIGQPNVGKSSIINALVGEERVIVTDIPHTTREPNNIPITYQGKEMFLIDTAGLQKKRQRKTLTALSMEKTMKAIGESSIVVLVLDATKPLTSQDVRLASLAHEKMKGVILVVNKWDLIEDKDPNTIKKFENTIQHSLPFLKGSPFLFTSAISGKRVQNILDLILLVWDEMNRTITPKELERFMKSIVKIQKPRQARGTKKPRIYAITQTGINPPWFVVRIGKKDSLHTAYQRFIENSLRDRYGFRGASIKFVTQKGLKKGDRPTQNDK